MSDVIQLLIVVAVIAGAAAYLLVRRLRKKVPYCDKCPQVPERPRLLHIGRKPGVRSADRSRRSSA